MYQFKRAQVLPIFLQRQISLSKLSRIAGVSEKTIKRAVDGLPVQASVVNRICLALSVNPLDVLVENGVEFR